MTAPFAALTVPIDVSAYSQHAIVAAIAYGHGFSKLHFCSVVEPTIDAAAAMGAIIDVRPLLEARQEAAQSICNAAVATARQKGATADATVLSGLTADSVAEFAHTNGSDAILICTHARTGLARLTVGSVTEDILVRSSVPVIVIHANDEIRQTGPVTLAFDGSAGAEAARKTAEQIAAGLGREIVTVGVEGERDVAGEIIARAQAAAGALIVMGTYGRSGIARAALGSVAAAVIERAPLPVVVVRAR